MVVCTSQAGFKRKPSVTLMTHCVNFPVKEKKVKLFHENITSSWMLQKEKLGKSCCRCVLVGVVRRHARRRGPVSAWLMWNLWGHLMFAFGLSCLFYFPFSDTLFCNWMCLSSTERRVFMDEWQVYVRRLLVLFFWQWKLPSEWDSERSTCRSMFLCIEY